MGDAPNMVTETPQLGGVQTASRRPQRAAISLPPFESAAERSAPATLRMPQPQARCGSCGTPIRELPPGRSVRCPGCRHRLIIPPRVVLTCGRCGRVNSWSPRDTGRTHVCTNCGGPLLTQPLTLERLRHHRHRAPARRHTRVGQFPGDAAWAVLTLALTILICLWALGWT